MDIEMPPPPIERNEFAIPADKAWQKEFGVPCAYGSWTWYFSPDGETLYVDNSNDNLTEPYQYPVDGDLIYVNGQWVLINNFVRGFTGADVPVYCTDEAGKTSAAVAEQNVQVETTATITAQLGIQSTQSSEDLYIQEPLVPDVGVPNGESPDSTGGLGD